MKQKSRALLSLVLVLCMLFTAYSVPTKAEESRNMEEVVIAIGHEFPYLKNGEYLVFNESDGKYKTVNDSNRVLGKDGCRAYFNDGVLVIDGLIATTVSHKNPNPDNPQDLKIKLHGNKSSLVYITNTSGGDVVIESDAQVGLSLYNAAGNVDAGIRGDKCH